MKLNRSLEWVLSLLMLIALTPLLMILFVIATIDSHEFGMFFQQRIGKNAKKFTLYKLQTIHPKTQTISSIGKFLRKYKLDELPQLINIFNGTMSFVGPRPDIPGYADNLVGDDRVILKIRPGVTGLASIKYRNEEFLLQQQPDSITYNDTVIWPDKVRINKWYVENHSFSMDVQILWYTLIPMPINIDQFIEKNSRF
ncbi:sugar transferase [Flavobacterium sp. SM2513]|uniref:sugar transferase n=1 Tax=Flavobacterium sp. SM2513 TaxID=3424766 RepID=UPI003D7FC1A6